MKKLLKIIKVLLLGIVGIGLLSSFSFAAEWTESATSSEWDASTNCIQLNTDIGEQLWIWNCVSVDKGAEAFANTTAGLGKLLVKIIVLVAFGLIVVWGVLIASSGAYEEGYSKGKWLIMKAIIGIILLGLMGTILYMLNPNFFKM